MPISTENLSRFLAAQMVATGVIIGGLGYIHEQRTNQRITSQVAQVTGDADPRLYFSAREHLDSFQQQLRQAQLSGNVNQLIANIDPIQQQQDAKIVQAVESSGPPSLSYMVSRFTMAVGAIPIIGGVGGYIYSRWVRRNYNQVHQPEYTIATLA